MKRCNYNMKPIAAFILTLCSFAVFATPNQETKNDVLMVSAATIESTTVNELVNYGNKLHVITQEEITRSGPSSDLNQVLQQYVPGLYVAPNQGPFGYGTFSLNGGRSDDTLILIDGVRLNNRLYGGIYLDTLPLIAIDHIEVLQGAQSLSFGTQAISGVINIVTKKPTSKELSGEFSVGVDTHKGRTGDFLVQKAFDNAWGQLGAMTWVSKNKSSGYQPYRDSEYNGNITEKKRGYDLTTVGIQLSQTINDKARLQGFYQYTDASLDYANPDHHRSAVNKRDHHLATVSFEHFVSTDVSYSIRTHLNDWNTRYDRSKNLDNGGVNVLNDGDYWGFRDYGIQAQLKMFFLGDNEVVLGTDNQWYTGKDDVMVIDSDTAKANALYVQLRPDVTFLPDLRPSLGVRYEHFGDSEHTTVWMASTAYDVTENFTLRGQVGSAFKLPNAEQLFVNEPGSEMGNPNLKPEKSKNAEVGFDYINEWDNGGSWQLGTTGYARKIEDLITKNSDYYFVNGEGEIKMRGVTASTKINFTPEWYLSADATRNWLDSKNGVKINNIPEFFTHTRFGYNAPQQQWGAEMAARYIGSIKTAKDHDYGHYTIFDASIYGYVDNKQQHKLTLLVENIFDREYATTMTNNGIENIDSLGRPLTAEIRYTYRF